MTIGAELHDAIYVWSVALQQTQDVVSRLASTLSIDEKQRSERFHFDGDRRRYTMARGSLRMILSGYLDVSSRDLRFEQGRYGKPYLVSPSRDPYLNFNLSHCEDLALIAVTVGGAVGVDVERVRELSDLSLIIKRYFNAEEKIFLNGFPARERTAAFLALWARREATAKALGLDLSAALSKISLPVFSRNGGAVLDHLSSLRTDRGKVSTRWSLQDLELDAEHVGAVCVEGSPRPIQIRNFKL